MDEAAGFRQYVLRRQRELLRVAWLLCGDWGAAEDLVQTALAKAWLRWDRLDHDIDEDRVAHAYVRRILVSTSHDWRSRRWRGERPTALLPEPGRDQLRQSQDERSLEVRWVLVAAVQALPPRQRAVIVLRYFDDATEADTAAALGCSVGTVKSQTSKALTALRRHPGLPELQMQGSTT
ncbi:SigE family RNA polymerase sigma factor [Aquipuribacter hungaricus]|uniref:SigE family RNA polymerase sigma factor n=1 Tax=Aquipuribacter hungaricus TaxID=545624 RepID=UPI0030EDC6BC